MGEKIGQPITEVTGTPRLNPLKLPLPAPTQPAVVPEKEPVSVPVKQATKTVAGDFIHRAAVILGVPDEWVMDRILEIAGKIEHALDLTWVRSTPYNAVEDIHVSGASQ